MKLLLVTLTLILTSACEGGGRIDATDSGATPVNSQSDNAQQLFDHFNQYTDDAS